jgi:hypothetical protein
MLDVTKNCKDRPLWSVRLLEYAARTGSADIAESESRAALLGCGSYPLSAYRREERLEWQPLRGDEPPLAGTAGILASSERVSAKRSSCVSTQRDVIDLTRLQRKSHSRLSALSAGGTPALPGALSRIRRNATYTPHNHAKVSTALLSTHTRRFAERLPVPVH